MSNQGHGTILTSVVTAFVAVLPGDVLNYVEKLGSVLILAMVAEAGRRLVSYLWKGNSK